MHVSRGPLAAVAAVCFLIGGAAGLTVGRPAGSDPGAAGSAPSAVDRAAQTLLALGAGPSGSAPVPLLTWRYREDPADRGRDGGWADGGFGGRAVTVPFSPNAGRVTGPGAPRAYRGSVGWFTRQVQIPAAGRYELSFGSAHHEATVYVDGRRMRRHVGAYAPFSAVATLEAGPHTVAVRVDWWDPRAQADAGYARGWFNFGGLNRPVTLVHLGDTGLGALTVTTRLRGRTAAEVRVGVRVRNRGGTERRLQPQGVLVRGDVRTALPFGAVSVPAGASRTVSATVRVPGAALWSPDRPERYALELTVAGEATLRRMVGSRELRWSGARLRLNGRSLRLEGVGLPADIEGHGDAWTPADEARTVRELVSTGANATRSQLPLPESMPTTTDGPMFRAVDALGVTDYTGWYEGTDLDARGQAAAVRGRLAGLRRLFPDKPIAVTELGAVGTARIPGERFGSLAFQAELLGRRLQVLDGVDGLSGSLLWLLRDHALRPDFRGGSVLDAHPGLNLKPGLNEKGLFDYAGRPKPALRAVRTAFGRPGR